MFLVDLFRSRPKSKPKTFDPHFELSIIMQQITKTKLDLIDGKYSSAWKIEGSQIISNASNRNITDLRIDSLLQEYVKVLQATIGDSRVNPKSFDTFGDAKLNIYGVRKFVDSLAPSDNDTITNFNVNYLPTKIRLTIDIITFDTKNYGTIIDVRQGWLNGVRQAKWNHLIFQALVCQYNNIKVNRIAVYDPLTCYLIMIKIPVYGPEQCYQIINTRNKEFTIFPYTVND